MQLQNQSHTQCNQLTMNQWNLQNNFLVFTNQSGAKVKQWKPKQIRLLYHKSIDNFTVKPTSIPHLFQIIYW